MATMDTYKLDLIEKLVSWSGLDARKAKDLLERANWNVDTAYRNYKTSAMNQRGYNVGQAGGNRVAGGGAPVRHGAVYHGTRPEVFTGLGPVITGMGPMIQQGTRNMNFREPYPVPKFPVEKPKERVIPIQIESKPAQGRLERQQAVIGPASSHHPLPNKPMAQSVSKVTDMPADESWEGPRMSQSQTSYRPPGPLPVANRNSQSLQPKLIDHPLPENMRQKQPVNMVVKGDRFPASLAKGDNPPSQQLQKGDHPPPAPIGKPNPAMKDEVAPSSTPKLKRGISKISQNAMLVDEARTNILQDITEDSHDHMYVQTFVLPDVTGYSEDFRAFLEKDLIETSTLVSLEQAGRLNWWAEMGVCQRLLPMATSGDGNCLLHAASLAMWGIHDRQLMLRKALNDTLTKKNYRTALYRRWRWQQTQANKEAGLILSEQEWQTEWENVLRLASTTPRTLPGDLPRNNSCCGSMVTSPSSQPPSDSPVVYESLEDFHVFVLAHVIQRTIIVVADTILKDSSGDALAPIPFGGIYLPLECDPVECYRSPLLLTYDAAHFSALVPMDTNSSEKNSLPAAIPIVGPNLDPLPLHFSIDPGIQHDWKKTTANITMSAESKLNLLKRYLDMEKLPICGSYLDLNSDDKNSTGSYESDDGLVKDKKKDNKMSQQLQSVSKQFGSFGKSFGKKLKNLGKGNKTEEGRKGRKPSIGSGMTQSTKIPLTIAALGEQEGSFVWCCTLTTKRSSTHQKMIDNYLYDAGERFKKERQLKQLKNNEILSRTQNTSESPRSPCVTSGCHLYGTAETCYLCTKCFNEQKQQALDQEKEMFNSFPAKSNKTSNLEGQKVGKSKFYDMSDGVTAGQVEQVNLNETGSSRNKYKDVGNGRPLTVHLPATSNSVAEKGRNNSAVQNRRRTPSPDYDNVDYKSFPAAANGGKPMQNNPNHLQTQKANPKVEEVQVAKQSAGNKCRIAGCQFFGNKDMDFMCSACYKSKRSQEQQQQQQLRHV